MKTSPSHRIRLNARANARPLNANEAIRGSPSPWNVLIMMPTQIVEIVKRLHVSALERVVAMAIQKAMGNHSIFRTYLTVMYKNQARSIYIRYVVKRDNYKYTCKVVKVKIKYVTSFLNSITQSIAV